MSFIRLVAKPVLLLLMSFSTAGHASSIELLLGSEVYQVELASSVEQRRQGLMHRQQLGPREGMLLVYPEPGDRRIWMKNVLIPLWVYWIDADLKVIERRRLEPCKHSPCPVYAAEAAAKYVLELGDYSHPLDAGDRIEGIRLD